MEYREARDLLEKYVGREKGIIDHSIAVSEFLYEISSHIKEKNPDIDIDPERMRVIGLLHDIGKLEDKNHFVAGAEILEREGLPEIAEVVKKHGIAKEVCRAEGIEGDFEPESLEEKLLTYADARVKHDKIVSFEKRFRDFLERTKRDKEKYEAAEEGYKRIKKIVKEIEDLRDR